MQNPNDWLPSKGLFSIAEVVALTGMSRSWLYDQKKKGKVKFKKFGPQRNSAARITRNELIRIVSNPDEGGDGGDPPTLISALPTGDRPTPESSAEPESTPTYRPAA